MEERLQKTHLGNNQYAYRLLVFYRLDEHEEGPKVQEGPQKGEVSYSTISKDENRRIEEKSPYYTSKMKYPPQARGEKPRDGEKPIRNVLTRYHKRTDGKFKETSLHATDKSTGEPTKADDHFTTASNVQIASLYYHSEVQAASEEKTPKNIAESAVRNMIKEVTRETSVGLWSLVVTSVFIIGYSDDRTVCGNACKPALADLAERISKAFESVFSKEKEEAKNRREASENKLFIRHSKEYKISAHVGAGHLFPGFKLGAHVITDPPTTLDHRVVGYKPPSQAP